MKPDMTLLMSGFIDNQRKGKLLQGQLYQRNSAVLKKLIFSTVGCQCGKKVLIL